MRSRGFSVRSRSSDRVAGLRATSASRRASRSKCRRSHGASKSRHSVRVPSRVAQLMQRIVAPRQPRKRARHRRRGRHQLALDPAAEHAPEHAQRVRLRQFLKHRVDPRLHRPPPQQLRAERVNGADERAVQLARARAMQRRARSISCRTRSFILPAAACVNVTATMRSTGVPAATTSTIRSTSADVFPVPAEPRPRNRRTAPVRPAAGARSPPPPQLPQARSAPPAICPRPAPPHRARTPPILAALTPILARRRRQKPVGDRPIDPLQHRQRAPPRPIIQRHIDHLVIPRDGGVPQPAQRHRSPNSASAASAYSAGCSASPPPTISGRGSRGLPVL